MFLFIYYQVFAQLGVPNSNTSHVLIYPYGTLPSGVTAVFKYISCSYLSFCRHISPSLSHRFKYISCSYLSILKFIVKGQEINSNTSHVLIYLSRSMLLTMFGTNSNTSHVLIYPRRFSTAASTSAIQIHLMFLFIVTKSGGTVRAFEFKYISCSYLSVEYSKKIQPLRIQIHLMFLFILVLCFSVSSVKRIQIHLMFLFIDVSSVKRIDFRLFKYISCSYLSLSAKPETGTKSIQIHLMFLFI